MSDCNGDGTCAPALLHLAGARCAKCGGGSFDHDTDAPDEAFCLDGGEQVEAPAEDA